MAFIAVTILVFTSHSSLVKIGIILGLGIIIAQSFVVSSLALFQARVRYDQSLISDVFGAISNLIFVYIAIVSFDSILFIIIALVLGNTVRAVVAIYLAKFQIGIFAFAFNRDFWRKLVLAALPIGIITIFSQFNAQIDKQIILLANYKPALGLSGEFAVGVYGLAYKIFELAVVLPTYILNVGFPVMVRKKEEGYLSLLTFTKKLSVILFLLGILSLILGLLLAPLVVNLLGGEKFSSSVLTIRVLFIGAPLFFVTPITLWLAVILKKTKEMMFIYGFVAAFNLVANLIFVPNFGYNAAAAITIVSEFLIFVMSSFVLLMDLRKREL